MMNAKIRLGARTLTALYCLFLILGFAWGQPEAGEGSPYLAGRLLVALPEMKDPRFVETVLYIVNHDQHGAMALVLNRPLARRRIGELLASHGSKDETSEHEVTVHYGGPVEPARGFVLHTDDYRLDTTIRLQNGVSLTGDVEILRAMARAQGPRRALFALGFAGWAPGQLEAEMKRNAWFVIPAEEELIFGDDWKAKWQRAMDKRKIDL